MSNWGYTEENGPARWHVDYPVAKEGKRQSPIDIVTSSAQTCNDLNKKAGLKWSYVPENVKDIENTGSSWKVNVDGSGSCVSGGPLDSEYELWQFHAHWGSDNAKGSEHTIDGKSYAAEVSDEEHPELAKVIAKLPSITHKGQRVALDEVNPAGFLPDAPEGAEFWTYEGSLTTPPLLESVIWIVFKSPIKISEDQIKAMRALCCSEESCGEPLAMVDNFRPPCPLGERTVRKKE